MTFELRCLIRLSLDFVFDLLLVGLVLVVFGCLFDCGRGVWIIVLYGSFEFYCCFSLLF